MTGPTQSPSAEELIEDAARIQAETAKLAAENSAKEQKLVEACNAFLNGVSGLVLPSVDGERLGQRIVHSLQKTRNRFGASNSADPNEPKSK